MTSWPCSQVRTAGWRGRQRSPATECTQLHLLSHTFTSAPPHPHRSRVRAAAAGAMAALQSKRDAMHRRAEGLIKCKTEFQELAKCL